MWIVVLDAAVLLPLTAAVLSPASREYSGLVNLSAGLGLAATSLLVVVVVLVSRLRDLTERLGLELCNDLHRRIARAAVLLTVAHVVAAVLAAPNGLGLLDPGSTTTAARCAIGGVVLLLVVPTVVVPRAGSRRYALRSRLHALLAVVSLVLIGVHVVLLRRMVADPYVVTPMIGLTVLLIVVLLRRWVVRPLFDRDAYLVRAVRHESASTATVVLVRARAREARIVTPGQFMWLRLRREVTFAAEHPFTVAAVRGPAVELTVRRRGDFTAEVIDLRPGRRVWLDGPHGAFVPTGIRESHRGLVLIAAGVGITPIISILRAFAAANDPRELRLLLAERHNEALFRSELATLSRRLRLTVTRVRGRRLDAPLLTEVLPVDAPELRDYYLCGPPKMVGVALGVLDSLGVPGAQIHTEQFG